MMRIFATNEYFFNRDECVVYLHRQPVFVLIDIVVEDHVYFFAGALRSVR